MASGERRAVAGVDGAVALDVMRSSSSGTGSSMGRTAGRWRVVGARVFMVLGGRAVRDDEDDDVIGSSDRWRSIVSDLAANCLLVF